MSINAAISQRTVPRKKITTIRLMMILVRLMLSAWDRLKNAPSPLLMALIKEPVLLDR